MLCDLIIFDCDGTLVDSEYMHNKVVADHLAALGFPQYTAEYNMRAFAGKGMQSVVETIERETGKPLPPSFIDDYIKGVNVRMPELLRKIDGVAEVVRALDEARVKICVGSNGERANVLQTLHVSGLKHHFPDENIFTKDMVVHPKPAPDLYLHAAKRMGVDPSRAVVIEDSITGATAGKAAGMVVIGFTATFHEPHVQEKALRAVGVDHVTQRFTDILDFISAGKA